MAQTTQFSFRLSDELLNQIKQRATDERRTVSQSLVVTLEDGIRAWLATHNTTAKDAAP
jgi:hypothetical protein